MAQLIDASSLLDFEGVPLFLPLYYQGGADHLCGGRFVKQEGFFVAWRN